jgi:hypothetical protein
MKTHSQGRRRVKFAHVLRLSLIVAAAFTRPSAEAQSIPTQPWMVDAKVRLRHEVVDWFGPPTVDTRYSFSHVKAQLGAGYNTKLFSLYAQGQYTQFSGLPLAGTGIGAVYAAANEGDRDAAAAYVRQAHVTVRNSTSSLSAQVGRFLYTSGLEATHTDKTVTWLKTKRIAQRMIGPFEFTNGRSYDGVRLDAKSAADHKWTLFLSHPTQGGFEVDGMTEIDDITLGALAWTVPCSPTSEGQMFLYLYGDDRGIIKTDNRPLPIRNGDTEDIEIATVGGYWASSWPNAEISYDGVVWTALQAGDWGDQDHLAGSLVIEGGARAEQLHGQPWLRAGYTFGTGDSDPEDSDHHTFFQMMPTARPYAAAPFYNMQNTHDLYLQFIWKPATGFTLRSDVHHLRLAEDRDLLYSGSGANERRNRFGYVGVQADGADTIGTLIDIDLTYELNRSMHFNLYYGYLAGSGVVREVSAGSSDDLHYALGEVTVQW